jgi:DNA polymerase-3 subunit beta
MKTTLKLSEFVSALAMVNNSIPDRPTNPILAYCKLENNNGITTLTGFDLQLLTTIRIPDQSELIGESSIPGTILFPPKPILELCQRLNTEFLTFIQEDNQLFINRNYQILLISPEDYPALPPTLEDNTINLPVDMLKTNLNFANSATSNDETKMLLTGINFSNLENKLKLASTDGYRLAVASPELEEVDLSTPLNLTIPAKSIRQIIKAINKQNTDNIQIKFNKSYVQFDFDNLTIISRLLDGNYPNYSQFLPSNFSRKLIIEKKSLIQALERLAIFTGNRNIIKFFLSSESIILETEQGELGQGKEPLLGEFYGEPLEINFNIKYLIAGLKELPTDSPTDLIQMQLNSENAPVVFSPIENNKYLYLVMPIQKL